MMVDVAYTDRFNWWLPLFATIGTFVVFVAIAIWQSDGVLYLLIVVPIITLSLLVFLAIAAIRKRLRRSLAILFMLFIFWAVSAVLLRNSYVIRNTARWLIWSRAYKSEVLEQPDSPNGELKHIEWDGWGFTGADTTVYLVFDPTDSLSTGAESRQPSRFRGIPCKVPLVSRLESRWYAVLFYTDERWGTPGRDCGMSKS